jgi:hypothetical protein
MSIPSDQLQRITKVLTKYCAEKVPNELKNKVRVNFKIRGKSITLFEERPLFFKEDEWVDINVAQFRFNPNDKKWRLYCSDRNSRWHEYYEMEPSLRFEKLLEEVEDDPTCIFWG